MVAFNDLDLGRRRWAASWSQPYQPSLLIGELTGFDALMVHEDGTRTLTVYWQGQRGQRRQLDNRVVWSRYPDLDPQGGTDYFVFRTIHGNAIPQPCLIPTSCWTEYRGDPGTQAFVILDDIRLLSRGRGKTPQTTGIAFEIQAFTNRVPVQEDGSIDYRLPEVEESSLKSVSTVMLVDASGKQLIQGWSLGVNPDDPDKPAIHKEGYRFTFPATGCYEFRLLDVFVYDVDDLEYVWYSDLDPDVIKVLRVDHVEGEQATVRPSETCGFTF